MVTDDGRKHLFLTVVSVRVKQKPEEDEMVFRGLKAV